MALRPVERDGIIEFVSDDDPTPDDSPKSAFRPFRWLGWIGRKVFRLAVRPRMTPDGFALLNLSKFTFNGQRLTESSQPRYATPGQQAILGWCLYPFLGIPATLALMAAFGIGGPVDTPLERWFVAFFLCNWVAAATCFFFGIRTLKAIVPQFYEEAPGKDS